MAHSTDNIFFAIIANTFVAQNYWCEKLKIDQTKFQKVIVTKSIREGTYTKKSEYGVLTIYFSNTKIRDSI
jgi:hypothetical protein